MSDRFYGNPFALQPEMRPLFEAHLGGQGMPFVGALATIVALLADEAALERAAAALGRAHEGYGEGPEHHPLLGHALLGSSVRRWHRTSPSGGRRRERLPMIRSRSG